MYKMNVQYDHSVSVHILVRQRIESAERISALKFVLYTGCSTHNDRKERISCCRCLQAQQIFHVPHKLHIKGKALP